MDKEYWIRDCWAIIRDLEGELCRECVLCEKTDTCMEIMYHCLISGQRKNIYDIDDTCNLEKKDRDSLEGRTIRRRLWIE